MSERFVRMKIDCEDETCGECRFHGGYRCNLYGGRLGDGLDDERAECEMERCPACLACG